MTLSTSKRILSTDGLKLEERDIILSIVSSNKQYILLYTDSDLLHNFLKFLLFTNLSFNN